MNAKKIIDTKRGPERIIQNDLMYMLRGLSWSVRETHGNVYQNGFPDLYIAHKTYRTRWVEVKNPLAYAFTPAQLEYFQELSSKDVGVWILTAATETEYKKLFQPANWYQYLQIWKSGGAG